jgi:peroxiredoxin Q/BCP
MRQLKLLEPEIKAHSGKKEKNKMKIELKVVLWVAVFSAITMGGEPMLDINSDAPDFSLSAQDGSTVRLSDFREKNSVVLIFYPGDETPVCTKQLCEIRDDYSSFSDKGAVVFGINPGSEKSHQKFAQKHNFQFKLLIDKNGDVAKSYKAKGKVMNQRTVYVINPQGKVIYAQRGKPPVSEILASIPSGNSNEEKCAD